MMMQLLIRIALGKRVLNWPVFTCYFFDYQPTTPLTNAQQDLARCCFYALDSLHRARVINNALAAVHSKYPPVYSCVILIVLQPTMHKIVSYW